VSDSKYVMTVSRNGQVSIPAATRARWQAEKVIVVDLGDHVLIRPALADPVRELRGKYAGRGPSSDQMRRQARDEEVVHESRHGG
jgi:bifunctional DNA-binding transcriptional regulator/antitoxin component of YhaV-PrlF toxin-antitoxin module